MNFERTLFDQTTSSQLSGTHFIRYQISRPTAYFDLTFKLQVFTRANHFMPRQRPGEYEYQYKKRLSQVMHRNVTQQF